MTGGTSLEGASRAAWLLLVVVAALAVLVLAPGGARAAGPPNGLYSDPGFAGCESQDSVTGCQDNEQWDLFGPLPGNTCPAPVTETP